MNIEKYKKPLIIGSMVVVGGYIIYTMRQNASSNSVPDLSTPASSENTTSPITFSEPALPDTQISTAPQLGPASPINVSDTPTYMTYNYGNPNSVLQGSMYSPDQSNDASDCGGCCDGCSDANSVQSGITALQNQIPVKVLNSQVSNLNSPNVGTTYPTGTNTPDVYNTGVTIPFQSTGAGDANPGGDVEGTSFQGVLGNGATNSVHTNHIMNSGVAIPVTE